MNEQKKYEFTGEIKVVFGINFKQIRAIINFGCVVAGEIGGWIESEENLSQSGDAWVSGDAEVKKDDDYMVVGGAGRYNRFTTFFKCRDKTIKVVCGCFFGTIIEFRAKVKETHKGNKHEKVYLAMADMVELQLDDK
nr:MAG TPA: Putative transferase, nesg, ydcK, Structural Genomics.38A [Caudoviricetes sp.]